MFQGEGHRHCLSHYWRTPLVEAAKLLKWVLFADIATAYYAVIKELGAGLPGGWDQDRIAKMFNCIGCGRDCFHDFRHQLDTPAQAKAGVSRHLTTLIIRLQENTWSVMQGSELFAVSDIGTRPGDPLADVLFAFICQSRIESVVERFRRLDIFPHLHSMRDNSFSF